MTRASKLKQRVRARMAKTGESYAAARAHVTSAIEADRQERTHAAAAAARETSARGTVSEPRCIEKTGHGFEHWFGVLDRFRAHAKGHAAAARHLGEEHGVPAWYRQTITVMWERARGLRVENQSGEGGFQVSVTRVLPRSRDAIADDLEDADFRAEHLLDDDSPYAAALSARLAEQSFRRAGTAHTLHFAAGDAAVDVRIAPKPDGRCTLAVQVRRLPDKARVERARAQWRALLDRLRAVWSTAR